MDNNLSDSQADQQTDTPAKKNKPHRQEPIFPIPLHIEVDEARASLGETLFFDTRLSKNNSIACANCHQLEQGGDDNVSLGISMTGEKNIINTPSIFNAQYNFRQNWDGSASSLHEQIEAMVKSQHVFDNTWDTVITRLAGDTLMERRFSNIYSDGITKNNIIDALVEFEKILVTPNSRFDRFLRNEADMLSKEEQDGYIVFKELGCISCHQGINIGGNLYQKFGVFYNYIAAQGKINLSDHGRMNITKRVMDDYVFKVPSLRNVAVTAPYFHDGSAETIEEAISIMGKTQLGRELKVAEIILIKAFLQTLTGEYKNKLLDEQS